MPEGYTPSNPADAASVQNAKRYVQIPEKYADPKNTDLTFTVGGGTQTFDIDLK
ncbi:MAG TPA: hypothetical protein VMZ71_01090 [Gemmataceae bacterium]|nr:hypothetical protein [Gemmataceae bacterium]